LDLYRKNIGKLDNQYKRALAFTLMRRAMIRKMPYTEDMRPGDTANPYGASKAMVERMLTDIQKADPRWSVILLRYFNPIGAHESGLISGSLVLAEEMARAGVFKIVFSSSATVYGDPGKVPYTEDMQPGDTTSPYGTSKSMVERILTDIQKADPRWSVILLRYFNPIGAHESGLIGEQPNGIPNNLLPYICQVAAGKLPQLAVFGGDYPTPDGTGMRDYIHVMDLAEGHVAAMQAKSNVAGTHLLNLGSGRASSVLEIIRAFEAASGLTIPYEVKPRRAGDLACFYADPSYAKAQIGWQTQRDLTQMMEDSWRWVSNNPNGYDD
ncbi:UDP-glucose 4-epimerase GalE, partial [Neisseria meningitidis]|uniref:UDP-glucose 4-epimerase GalE n=1 Tax=Neisseria meningitidis TaxID=487 RepID=UPI003CC6438B